MMDLLGLLAVVAGVFILLKFVMPKLGIQP